MELAETEVKAQTVAPTVTTVLLAVAVVIDLTPLKRAAWWEASTAAPVLGVMLVGLKPALPESFSRFLN
jgi:membrane protein required for colicin V production